MTDPRPASLGIVRVTGRVDTQGDRLLESGILGVLDLSTPEIETPETVAARIRRALFYRKPEDIIVAPDCGLKYLPRDAAFGKMKAMVEGARIVRAEVTPQ